jgi:hypothetical protein
MMKSGIALCLLLLAAIAANAELAPARPGLAPPSGQEALSGPEASAPAVGAESAPGALPWVLDTDFSGRLGLGGRGSCGAKVGTAAFATEAADEIPPPLPQICCRSGNVTCCPAPRTCVLCDLLICCNPGR